MAKLNGELRIMNWIVSWVIYYIPTLCLSGTELQSWSNADIVVWVLIPGIKSSRSEHSHSFEILFSSEMQIDATQRKEATKAMTETFYAAIFGYDEVRSVHTCWRVLYATCLWLITHIIYYTIDCISLSDAGIDIGAFRFLRRCQSTLSTKS